MTSEESMLPVTADWLLKERGFKRVSHASGLLTGGPTINLTWPFASLARNDAPLNYYEADGGWQVCGIYLPKLASPITREDYDRMYDLIVANVEAHNARAERIREETGK